MQQSQQQCTALANGTESSGGQVNLLEPKNTWVHLGCVSAPSFSQTSRCQHIRIHIYSRCDEVVPHHLLIKGCVHVAPGVSSLVDQVPPSTGESHGSRADHVYLPFAGFRVSFCVCVCVFTGVLSLDSNILWCPLVCVWSISFTFALRLWSNVTLRGPIRIRHRGMGKGRNEN